MKQMILISLLSLPQHLPLSSSIFFSFFVHREIERAAASLARSPAVRVRPSSFALPLLSHFLLRAFTFTRRLREDLAAKPSFLKAHLDS